ncbi:MAG TPA: hypothetical protein VJW20_16550 [Candidatus Angelobacter sp.]|nr:hypothetical protein [Candidatus Angelobacter sp.]
MRTADRVASRSAERENDICIHPVEMAGTLAEMSRMALEHDFRHIDPTSARILLYEAAPRVLPTYPEHLSIKAQRHL